MGAQLRYGTAGATGGGWSSQSGSLQPAIEERCHEPRWSWQARGPKTWKDKFGWYSKWSFGCRVGYGDTSGADGASVRDLSFPDLFEPFSCDGEGTSISRFIKGYTKDASAVVVANATVQAFRTSDDFYLGQDVSRLDGSYTCPVDVAAGTACYLVAYKAGAPDVAGTTVNTITPTDVAGN